MNLKLTISILIISLISFNLLSQNTNLSGTYSFGKDINESDVGELLILQKSSDSLLVYISVSKAAPSYTTRNLLTKLVVNDNIGYFKDSTGSALTFKFEENKIIVSQGPSNSSFNIVSLDRTFYNTNNKEPKYFYLGNGEQIKISEKADIFADNYFLKEGDLEKKQIDEIKRKYILGNKEVNVYEYPNLNSKIVSVLKNGEEVFANSEPFGDSVYYLKDNSNMYSRFVSIQFKHPVTRIKAIGYVINDYLINYKPLFLTSINSPSEELLLNELRRKFNSDNQIRIKNRTEFGDYFGKKKIYGINKELYSKFQLNKISLFDKNSIQIIDPTGGENLEHFEVLYSFNGTLDLSPNFYTLVVGFDYYNSYEEYLVNYTKDGELIDYVLIGVGDTVESFVYEKAEFTRGYIMMNTYEYTENKNQDLYYKIIKSKKISYDGSGIFNESKLNNNSSSKNLEVTIKYNKKAYNLGEDITVNFLVKNNSNIKLSYCFWHTPFEGFKSNIFSIYKGNKLVSYKGIMKKRKEPSSEHYIELKPNEFKEVSVIINEAYDLSKKGNYTIIFDSKYRNDLDTSNEIQIRVE
jgi:hypothetical protein